MQSSLFISIMDPPNALKLELEATLKHEFVFSMIRRLQDWNSNLVISCVDGGTVFTNKRFISVYSSVIKNICSDIREEENITLHVEFKKTHVDMMMEYFNTGELRSQDVSILNEVLSLMQSLGVSVKDAEIFEPYKIVKSSTESSAIISNVTLDITEELVHKETKENIIEDQPHFETDLIQFKCQKCEKVFKSRPSLKQHSIVHTNVRPFECQECGKRFSTKGILNNHRGVHNPKKCDYCTKTFAQKSWLKSHIKYAHSTIFVNHQY